MPLTNPPSLSFSVYLWSSSFTLVIKQSFCSTAWAVLFFSYRMGIMKVLLFRIYLLVFPLKSINFLLMGSEITGNIKLSFTFSTSGCAQCDLKTVLFRCYCWVHGDSRGTEDLTRCKSPLSTFCKHLLRLGSQGPFFGHCSWRFPSQTHSVLFSIQAAIGKFINNFL